MEDNGYFLPFEMDDGKMSATNFFRDYEEYHCKRNTESGYMKEHALADVLPLSAPASLWSLVGGKKERSKNVKVVMIAGVKIFRTEAEESLWKEIKSGAENLLQTYFRSDGVDDDNIFDISLEYATSLVIYFTTSTKKLRRRRMKDTEDHRQLKVISLINFTHISGTKYGYLNWVVTSSEKCVAGDGASFQKRGLTSLLLSLLWDIINQCRSVEECSSHLFLQCQHFECRTSPLSFYFSRGFSMLERNLPYGHSKDMYSMLPVQVQECIDNTRKKIYGNSFCHFISINDLEDSSTHPLHLLSCRSQPTFPWTPRCDEITYCEDELCRTYLGSEIITHQEDKHSSWTLQHSELVYEFLPLVWEKLRSIFPLYSIPNVCLTKNDYTSIFRNKSFCCPLHAYKGTLVDLMVDQSWSNRVDKCSVSDIEGEEKFSGGNISSFYAHLREMAGNYTLDDVSSPSTNENGCCLHWMLHRYVSVISRIRGGDKKFHFLSTKHMRHGRSMDSEQMDTVDKIRHQSSNDYDGESFVRNNDPDVDRSENEDSHCQPNAGKKMLRTSASDVKNVHFGSDSSSSDDDSTENKTVSGGGECSIHTTRVRRLGRDGGVCNDHKRIRITLPKIQGNLLSLENSDLFRSTIFFHALWDGYKKELPYLDGVKLSKAQMKKKCTELHKYGCLPNAVSTLKDLEDASNYNFPLEQNKADPNWENWKTLLSMSFQSIKKKITKGKNNKSRKSSRRHGLLQATSSVVGLTYSPDKEPLSIGTFGIVLSNEDSFDVPIQTVLTYFPASIIYTAVSMCLSGEFVDPDEAGDRELFILGQSSSLMRKEIIKMKAYYNIQLKEYSFKGLFEKQGSVYDLGTRWAKENFRQCFLDELIHRYEKGKTRGFVDVPVGKSIQEEEPYCPRNSDAPKIWYPQVDQHYCLFYSLASVLHAIGYVKEGDIVSESAEKYSGGMDAIKNLNMIMQQHFPYLQPTRMKNPNKFDIFSEEAENNIYPRILVLKGKEDGDRSHAVAMCGRWIFDANWKKAKIVTQEILNWCVSGSGRRVTYHGIVCAFTYRENQSTRPEKRKYKKPSFL